MSFCAASYRLPWWSIRIIMWRTQCPYIQQLKSCVGHTYAHTTPSPLSRPHKNALHPRFGALFCADVGHFVAGAGVVMTWTFFPSAIHFTHTRCPLLEDISPTSFTSTKPCWQGLFVLHFFLQQRILSFICILDANSCIDYQKLCYYCDWISWNRSFDKF